MAEKIGPREAALRAAREQRAKDMQKLKPKVQVKAIGKLQHVKASKGAGRGR